uniref:Uncharacterized protein n=1 Tax=Romanomermis culicivorax TaxID=13658 RepID=A0A915IS89_ROMCU
MPSLYTPRVYIFDDVGIFWPKSHKFTKTCLIKVQKVTVVRSNSSSRRIKNDGGTDKRCDKEDEKMTNAYRTPPVLLHACKEFAIFSIKNDPKKTLNVNEIIELTTLKTCLSNCSIQSSESDSSLTYRSPAIQGSTSDLLASYAISPSTDSGACRSRSQSECGTQFPKKGKKNFILTSKMMRKNIVDF